MKFITIKSVVAVLISLIILAAFVKPGIRQRAQILILYTLGDIQDMTFQDNGYSCVT